MKHVRYMRTLASILLLFFLFTSIVLRMSSAINTYQQTAKTFVAKKDDASTKSDTQFLFDVKEVEERSENGNGNEGNEDLQNNFHFLGLINTPAFVTTTASGHYALYSTSHSLGNASGIPLYIAQRSFLI